MKGSNLLTALAGAKDRALGHLKNYLEQRTPRQRSYIVLTALLLFAVVDIWMIVRSFQDKGRIPAVECIEIPINQ